MSDENRRQPVIFLVDDAPTNLELLEAMLGANDYAVRSFSSGESALAAAAASPPDLILLDIDMPGMDGYRTCERLKALPALRHIPIIFISALSDALDKVRAFGSGGVDYVTKPFEIEEVLARVETHLKLRRLQAELEEHNAHLDDLVRERTSQLERAHSRLSILDQAKSDFLMMISHELRSPLQGMLGVASLFFSRQAATPEDEELREIFRHSRDRLLKMIDDAQLLSQIDLRPEKFRPDLFPLAAILDDARRALLPFAEAKQVTLGPLPPGLGPVYGEPRLLVRAFRALLETAVKFSAPGRTVELGAETDPGESRLDIEAVGHGIPDDVLPGFFEILAFQKVLTPAGDLSLDPPVAQRIISLFGGQVTVESRNPPGIRFTVRLATAAE